jgi:SpoIID/LytB domain protein
MMKKFSLLKLLLLAIVLTPIAPARAAVNPSVPAHFIVSGSGFGHGVGMSQIGALGQALEGKSASDILSYYFPGTTIAPYPDNQDIRVNIGHALTYATFTMKNGLATVSRSDGSDAVQTVATPSVMKFSISKSNLSSVVMGRSGRPYLIAPALTINLNPGALISISTSAGSISINHGAIAVEAIAGHLEVVNIIKAHDQYIYGISEISGAWPQAALMAQAIASRTYGLARLGTIRKECDCNVYASINDQNFIGAAKELDPNYGSAWKSAVDLTTVDASSSLAILFNGKPINVYFFASSGGMTQRSADVWGTAFPYLTNVPDPWSLDIYLNPNYAHWLRVLTQAQVATAFNLPDVVSVNSDNRSVTGSVLSLVATSSSGAVSTLAVGTFKTKLKIPASWFSISTDFKYPGYFSNN